MRKSAVDKFREQLGAGAPAKKREINSIDDLLALLLGGAPLTTQRDFLLDSVPEQAGRLVRVKGYMGPLGCAKTATLCAAGLLRALLVPGSRLLVSRQTYGELETTTQSRFMEQVRRLPNGIVLDYNRTPPARLTLMPIVQGEKEPSEIIFHSLDDPQKIAGVEFTDAIVDEASEITSDTIHKIETRCGRREGTAKGGPFFLMLAFNPPSTNHWLYQEGVTQQPPYIKLYRPVPNENARNLPQGYYESLARTLPPDMRKRLIDGEWGADFGGKPVYQDFRYGLHVDPTIAYLPGAPVYRFWDFGYNNPCCLVAQKMGSGHIRVIAEIDGRREEIEPFVKRVKSEMQRYGIPVSSPEGGVAVSTVTADYGDPAAYQHRDTGQTSARLIREGIHLIGKPSRIDDGLAVVRDLLSRLADGSPLLTFHPRCTRLIEGLMGGYRYKEVRDGQQAKLLPWKDDFYDHAADALRYGCIHLNFAVTDPKIYRQMLAQTSALEEPPNLE